MNAFAISNSISSALYLLLAIVAAWRWKRGVAGLLFAGALAATAAWLAAMAWLGPTAGAAQALDGARAAGWLAFLAQLHREGRSDVPRPGSVAPAAAVSLALGLALALPLLAVPEATQSLLHATGFGHLLIASAGLVLVESLLRHARPETIWRLKHLTIAAGLFFAFDLFLYAEALLFQRLDPTVAGVRGALFAVLSPLLVLAAARNPAWTVDLHVSRRAALQTVSLVGVGVYLLALAATASLLGAIGSEWGPVFQTVFLGGAVALLAVVLLSGTVRSHLALSLRRAFFTRRYDYHDEWAGFVDALSSPRLGVTLGERALRAMLELMDCPQGAIWLLEGSLAVQTAQLGLVDGQPEFAVSEAWLKALEGRADEVIELGSLASGAPEAASIAIPPLRGRWIGRRDGGPCPELPEAAGRLEQPWLLLPLRHRERTIGFALLSRPRAPRAFDWEDRALLAIVGAQVASYLAEDRASRSLEETRRFASLARRTSFIAHDLRNLSNELGLTLANARRHIEKPEFQRDLLMTMEESVARMKRLLARLAEGDEEPAAGEPTDMADVLKTVLLAYGTDGAGLDLEVETAEPVQVDADRDRLAALVGHLVQNAAEAAGAEGTVRLRLTRSGSLATLEVEDDGDGMDPERANESLRHPFTTPAPSGFGIGLYQCRELSRSLGGRLELDTERGRGTIARVELPARATAVSPSPEVGPDTADPRRARDDR